MTLRFRQLAKMGATIGAMVGVTSGAAIGASAAIAGELPPIASRLPPQAPATSRPAPQLDMATAVALTLARHPDIARANAAVARGQADLGAARSVWTPQLSYQANLGPHMLAGSNNSGVNENMAGPTVFLQQQVWDFGRSKGEIGAARSTTHQRWYEREAMADQLAEQSALAFLEVRRFEMLAQAAQTQLGDLAHLRELIGMRVHAGISDKSDLMLADVRVESARGDAIQAQTSAAMARAVLTNLTGIIPGQLADATALISRFEPVDQEPDYDRLPAVSAAMEAAEAASAKIGQTKAERYPRLGLQLGYTRNNYTYNSRDNALTAVMTVTGNLYRRSDHYLIEAAEEDRRAAEAARDSTVIEARGRALTAQQEIRAGSERIGAYARQEEQAVTASRIFLEEYKLGKRTLTELLNTQLEIYRASSARIVAEHDIMEARVRFENLSGSLRPSLGLPAHLSEEDDPNG